MHKKYLVLVFHGFKAKKQYIHLQTPMFILYWLWTDENVTCYWNLWKLLSFALNVIISELPWGIQWIWKDCHVRLYFIHSLFGKNEQGHFKPSKEKAASQPGKNQFLCVQILCCELLFVHMEALPCNFLVQQMKWISCFMLTLQIVLEGQTHLISDLSDHHNKCKESGMWRDTVSMRMSTCNNVTSIVYNLYRVFYILNLWMCQAD